MQLCISNIAWLPAENDRIIHAITQQKVKNIEAAPSLLSDDFISLSSTKIEYILKQHQGVNIKAMQSLLYGHDALHLFSGQETRNQLLRHLTSIIQFASQLGVERLIFGSPRNRQRGDLPMTAAMRIADIFFNKVGDICKKHNIILCLEPNAPEYGCDFGTNTLETLEIVRTINHDNIALNIDLGVMCMNDENIEKVFVTAFENIRHIHISEPFLAPIDTLNAKHILFSQVIRQAGYQGLVSIEMKRKNDTNNLEHVISALNFVSEIYV